jgi:hypothetical protein
MSNRYESELSAFQDEVWASLEKYSRKLGWGLSGIQPENWILLDHAVDELVKLRDQLRWRKWPDEKPEVEQQCQLILANKLAPILCCSKYPFDHWENLNATHWRPIGPLPSEGGE